MKQNVQLFLLLAASFIGFLLYCTMLIDWVEDFRTGVYSRYYLEAIAETTGLVGYTYLAVRFAYSRLHLF